ncbi:MAG: cysteine desulfurase family protein [Nevskiales bacterium]
MPIYLDNNATTFLDPRVLEAMRPYLAGAYGNPSSVHRYGRAARDAIEAARAQIGALVNAKPVQVVFTSCATESNNLAVRGVLAKSKPGRVLISAVEHPSVWELFEPLKKEGWRCEWIPVGRDGVIDNAWLVRALAQGEVRLVSVMYANNETGVIQEAAAIGRLCRQHGAAYHCDAVQAAGKLPLDFLATGAHSMTLSSHKMYGPKGVAALVLDRALDIAPLMYGGGHEAGLRPGTENAAAIVGFGVTAELARVELAERAAHCLALREQLEAGLRRLSGIVIFGESRERLPNTTQFSLPGFDGEALLMALDRKGIAVSSGSACTAGKGEPSHVLLGMGVERGLAKGAVRVSLGKDNTSAEVEKLLAALRELAGSAGTAIPSVAVGG